jgi:transmembrane sensor
VSGNLERNMTLSGAEDVEAEAAVWFGRCNFWDWDEKDQTELDLWLAESPAHRIAYWRLACAWARTERLSALHRPTQVVDLPPRKIPFLKHAVAGFVIATMLGAAGWNFFFGRSERTFETPLGGRQTVIFADGTQIELNTSTLLRVRIDGRYRSAELIRGEAYFKVHHDSRNPFVVVAAGHRVTDLGTEFIVRSDGEHIQVSLVEGRARFESRASSVQAHSAVLAAGDVATASPTSMSVVRKSAMELSNIFAWRRGLLVFKYAPLSEAVAELNRYNSEKLVIAAPSVGERTIYGTIPTHGVGAFVRVAREVLGLRVEKRGAEFVISR